MTVSSELRMALLGQHPPIADWLQALSHDSPFERDQDTSIWDRDAPRLAAVPSLISLLKDPSRDVRIQAITALVNLRRHAQRALSALGAPLHDAALSDRNELA